MKLKLLFLAISAASSLAAAEAPPGGAGWGTLSATVVDAASGLPVPCTVEIRDSAGRVVTERASFRTGFRSDGRFRKRLPAGSARLRVSRGFETRALEEEVDVPAGGDREIRVALERIVDLRKRGWFAGDSHVHMLHGERTVPVTFDDVGLAARAEDLSYLSLAQAWTLDDPTPEKLSAELAARSSADCVLTWNLEAPKNYYRGDATRCLGHSWCLGVGGRTAEGEDVIHVLLEASAHDYESDKPTFSNFESHRLIRAQGGAAFYTHPARWWTGSWGGQGVYPRREDIRVSNMAVELPLDTLIGPSFDGLDVSTTDGEFEANELAFRIWCLLLNHGYRVAATASSDSCFDRPGGGVPGVVRTYTWLDGRFSLPAVTRATARGATFVTSGPLLLTGVDGKPPGSAFPADGKARQLAVEAWASGTDAKGLSRLDLYRDGALFKTRELSPPVPHLQTSFPIEGGEDAWYCVRLYGADRRQRAISGAFYFDRKPHEAPPPVPARVHVELRDADTGAAVPGAVTEVVFHGTLPRKGVRHEVPGGEGTVQVPAHARLQAEAPGYRPVTLSPFLDHAPLLEFITGLKAEDLVRWETFERVRALLGEVRLTFRLEKTAS